MTFPESLQFIEFGVLIRAEKVDTKLINETTLRRSKIIQDGDETELNSTVITPVHSRIEFRNGLEIVADQRRLQFTQQGEGFASDENRCPSLTISFLTNLQVRIPFHSVSTRFKAFIPDSGDNDNSSSTARFFADRASWSCWHGVLPTLNFNAIYQKEDTTTTLRVGTAMKGDDESTTGEMYEIDFNRELNMRDLDLKYERLMNILSGWDKDLEEFGDLVSNYQQV